MNLKEITELPTVLNNTHESCYRAYHILNQVLEMIDRGDSKESINEVVDYLRKFTDRDENDGVKPKGIYSTNNNK